VPRESEHPRKTRCTNIIEYLSPESLAYNHISLHFIDYLLVSFILVMSSHPNLQSRSACWVRLKLYNIEFVESNMEELALSDRMFREREACVFWSLSDLYEACASYHHTMLLS
jgi:hypothetical protein